MIQKIKTYLKILLYLLATTIIFAQNTRNSILTDKIFRESTIEDNIINYVHNKEGYLTDIEFICKNSGDICANFDITENNPFQKLPFPINSTINNSPSIFTAYDVANVDRKQLIQALLPNLDISLNDQCFAFTTNTSIKPARSKNKEHLAIGYRISLLDESGGEVAASTYLFKLNKQGQIVFEQKHINDGFYEAQITEDGRYLVYMYGVGGPNVYCTMGNNTKYGFKILDTHTGKIIANKQSKQDYALGLPVVHKDLVYFYCKSKNRPLNDRMVEIHVFDFEAGFEYTKLITFEERNRLHKITKNAFVFQYYKNETYSYEFEVDFKKNKIK